MSDNRHNDTARGEEPTDLEAVPTAGRETLDEPNAPRNNDDRTQPLGAPSAPDGDEHPHRGDGDETERTSDRLGGGHE